MFIGAGSIDCWQCMGIGGEIKRARILVRALVLLLKSQIEFILAFDIKAKSPQPAIRLQGSSNLQSQLLRHH